MHLRKLLADKRFFGKKIFSAMAWHHKNCAIKPSNSLTFAHATARNFRSFRQQAAVFAFGAPNAKNG
jgi:hypothetical protein